MKIFGNFASSKLASLDSTIEGFFPLFFARLSPKGAGIILLIFCFAFFEFLFPKLSFAFDSKINNFQLSSPSIPLTTSLFSEKITFSTKIINFSKKTIFDPTLKPGEEKILSPGIKGEKVTQVKTIFHKGIEFSREETLVSDSKVTEEIAAIGPFKSDNFLETPFGKLVYSTNLRLWATAYDSHCSGCDQTTSIGLQTGFGVVAVDPKVIPLRTKLYIPGYGLAIAGDTGGSIKGSKIDLGFADATKSGWSSRFVDVYLLN